MMKEKRKEDKIKKKNKYQERNKNIHVFKTSVK
jgi:hypothetical protein